jgi:hypothetical protein
MCWNVLRNAILRGRMFTFMVRSNGRTSSTTLTYSLEPPRSLLA